MRLSQLAFLQRLPSLTWMTDADKLKAASKLAAMAVLVGANAPEKRLNFSGVSLSTDDHFENAVQLRRFNFNDTKQRFYKPVDRELCQSIPQCVPSARAPATSALFLGAHLLVCLVLDS
jgi:predicted metalloendopeptidase